MRLWASIKLHFKVIYYQFPLIVLAYAIFPLLLAFSYSFVAFDKQDAIITVEVVDEDQSQFSRSFSEVFEQAPFKIVDEAFIYRVTIPAGYETLILNEGVPVIEIECKRETCATTDYVVTKIVEAFHQERFESKLMNHASLEANKQLLTSLKAINETEMLVVQEVAMMNISLYVQPLIHVSSIVFALIILNLGYSSYQIQEISLINRLHLLPLTKTQLYHYSIIEAFLYVFTMKSISFVIFSLFVAELRSYFLTMILIIGTVSLFASSIFHFIGEFIPRLMGKMILGSFLLYELSIGYFGIGTKLIPVLEHFWPGMIVQHLYEAGLTNQWHQFNFYAPIIVGTFIFVYSLIRLKLWLKWGRQ